MYTQGSYCIRAGGRSKAIADLRFFYQRKYTPLDPTINGLPRAIFHGRAGPILNPLPFTLEEIRDVAFMCKHNKSTGADGISYEALQMLCSEVAQMKRTGSDEAGFTMHTQRKSFYGHRGRRVAYG